MNKSKNTELLIIGGYGFRNIGDEAILSCLLKKVRFLYDKITVFSRNPLETISFHKVNAEKKNIRRFLSCDEIIVGGGELLQDGQTYKIAVAIILAKLMNKKVRVLGVGVDINGKVERFLAQISLKIADEISVRDKRSADNLVCMGITSKKVKIVDDLALCLEPKLTERVNEFFSNHRLTDSKFIILVLRQKKPDIDDMLLTFFAKFTSNLLHEKSDLKILLVPFSMHPDSPVDNDLLLLQKLKDKVKNGDLILIEEHFEPSGMLWLISKASLVITTRLHPLIFSKIVNAKVISIPLFPKIRSFAEEYGYPAIELKELDRLYDLTQKI